MNKSHVILIFSCAVFLSCKSKVHESNVINVKEKDSLLLDTIKENRIGTIRDMPESFSSILSKVEENKDLNVQEYAVLLDSLFIGNDESQSEQMGFLIFTYLKGSSKRCDKLLSHILSKSNTDQDEIFSSLIELMCIDILDEEYDYSTFTKEFKLFDNSKKAEIAFNKCMENK